MDTLIKTLIAVILLSMSNLNIIHYDFFKERRCIIMDKKNKVLEIVKIVATAIVSVLATLFGTSI